MTQARPWARTRAAKIAPVFLAPGKGSWEPLARQAIVAAFVVSAAVASAAVPWLLVTDATAMWWSVAMSGLLLAVSALMVRSPALRRAEILLPLGDFLAIGLLRFGTGDNQSVFLAIIVLPVIWIAAGRGRWRIAVPLLGTCATLLLPLALAPSRGLTPSELVRLLIALFVYAAAGAVVNELSRRSLQRLSVSQWHRRVAEGEVSQAASVQQSLQPVDGSELPAGFRVAGACVPSRTVGGDFYDWYATPDGGVAFTLGDVMGKGVGAGMIAAAMRTVIRSCRDDDDPAVAFHRASVGLNTGSLDVGGTPFTTCFHARLDADGTLRWVDAGHGLSVIRRADGETVFLQSRHLPIGVGTAWKSSEILLHPGDSVVSASDGVLDLFGGSIDSIERYRDIVRSAEGIDAVVDDLLARAAASDREDDVTVIGLTWMGDPNAAQRHGADRAECETS